MGVNGIYGLSGSGLDVESMVKVGMLSKQSELDKMQQKYTKNEWKKTEYLSLYGELQTFNNSTLSQYKMSSSMNARSASSSNSAAVTATANATAATMTHYVEVNKLASAAYLIGTDMPAIVGTNTVKNADGTTGTETKLTSTQLADYIFKTVEKGDSANTVKVIEGTDTKTFNLTDTAFEFSLNDGVNGLLKSSNEKAVTAYATPGAADSGSQTVVISALATGANSTGKLKDTITKNSSVFLLSWDSTLKDYLKANATDSSTALTYTFNDGTTTADISFSIADFNDTLDNFLKSLNKKFSEKGLTLEAMFTSKDTNNNGIDEGGILLQNTKVGSDSKFSITNSTTSDNFAAALSAKGITARSGYFANLLFLGGSSDTGVGNGDGITQNVSNGENVKGTINGTAFSDLTLTNADKISGNTVTFNGITYTAKDKTNGNVTITNGKPLTVAVTYGQLLNGYTFNDLTSDINSLGTNVRASYDTVQNKFYFYNKESGSENNMTFSIGTDRQITNNDVTVNNNVGTNTAAFFDALGLKQSAAGNIIGDALTFTAGKSSTLAGTDAQVNIDGVTYDLSSNKTTVNGVVYSFQNVTAENNKVAVSVTQDSEAIAKKVQSFVDDYNALLTKLYKWYDEKPNDKYTPLTESQKSSLKDEQVEKWEEKAKAGLLYHDKTLGSIITELRSAVSEKVEGVNGKYNTIFALGISTTGLKGQLTLDKDKLNAALAEDPDAVYNVFAKLDSGEVYYYQTDASGKEFLSKEITGTPVTDEDGKYKTKTVERASYNGIAQRLGDIFMTSMKNVKNISGSTADVTEDSELNNLLRELQTKMSNFQKMMAAFETKLYKKYDAMESSLALLGTQLNYVTGAFQ